MRETLGGVLAKESMEVRDPKQAIRGRGPPRLSPSGIMTLPESAYGERLDERTG